MKYGRIIASLLLTSTLTTAHASNAQQVTVSKVNSEYAKTKYPVVFVHGMAGFIRVGDVLGLDYWDQILPDLA
ncbi:MAG: triacylglycerol lipase, partial [Acinetobacter sp.]|nr:triacylglycerol lipase [Acinetobacter sp.]